MRKNGVALALALAGILASVSTADDPKGSGSAKGSGSGSGSVKSADPTKGDADQYVITNAYVGQINNFNADAKTFTLHVTTKNLVANPQGQADLQRAQADLQRAQQDYANALNIKDARDRAQKASDAQNRANQAQTRINQAQANQFKVEEKSLDVQFQLNDEVLVRTQTLPPFFDDKGNPRKPNDDELKELSQPQGAPGYKAATGDLQNGQLVEVGVGYKKGEPAPKPVGSGSGSASTTDPKEQPRQSAILIVIGKNAKPGK
jgi:hypothetical protein